MQTPKGLEKHSWNSLGSYFRNVNPELAAVIDDLSPSENYSLYLAKYPYGELILDKGIFQIFNQEQQIVPLGDSTIPDHIKTDLGYNRTMPTGLVSQNSIETFLTAQNRILPSSLFGPGDMVALGDVLEEDNSYQVGPLWNISSGARTICMLPKITDKNGYQALKKKYGLKLPIPRSLQDHWSIFKNIASHTSFKENWISEIIFFSKSWFMNKNDPAWANFYKFLLNKVWQSSLFRRNQFILDFAFSLAQENRNLKPNPYLADTVQHLIAIGSGAVCAFTTAIDNLAAPISGLQNVFIEDYNLKKYGPIMMHLHHFSLKQNRPVYYSLEMPTTTIFSPRSSRISSKMSDMRELKHIMEILLSEILKGNLYTEKTPLFNLAKQVKYNFFHSEKDQLNEIINAVELIKVDHSFTKAVYHCNEYLFPEFSPFFRGCISISKAK